VNQEVLKVGFTGTQNGLSSEQRSALLVTLLDLTGRIEAHHGMCAGADHEFHDIIRDNYPPDNRFIVGHPPRDKKNYVACEVDDTRDAKRYDDRNRDIVNESQILVACPKSAELTRSGTWSTVRYARSMAKTIKIILPNGSIQIENGSE